MNPTNLLDGIIVDDWMSGLEYEPPKPKPVRQYTDDEIKAILTIHEMDANFQKAFVRVVLSPPDKFTGKVGKSVKQHWAPIAKNKIPPNMSNWCYITPIPRKTLEAHIVKPDCIVGIIPFWLGLAVADIDKPEIEAVEAVTDALGTPLATFPTASGGWHSIYPIDSIDTAKMIKSSGYKIDGQHLGEMCCLHRFANCWSPINWLQCVKRRVNMTTADNLLTGAIIVSRLEWIGTNRTERTRKPKDQNAAKYKSSITIDDAVEYFNLKRSPKNGEWQGHCPQCDPHRTGGGTRFKANVSTDGRLLINCFECAEQGFDGHIYWNMVKPLEQIAKRKRIRESLERHKESQV